MPLRVVNGTPIPWSIGLTRAPMAALGAASNVLNISDLKQEQSEWCWACCMQMVFQLDNDFSISQCALANSAFGLSDCCRAPGGNLCNRPLQILNVTSQWNKYGYKPTYKNNSISWNEIQNELFNRRPVECGLMWAGGGGHAVLIIGAETIDPIGNWVVVNDPDERRKRVLYDDFVQAYGRGKWLHTWTQVAK